MAENLKDIMGQLNSVVGEFGKKMSELGNVVQNSTVDRVSIALNNKPATLIKLADGNVLIQFTDPTDGDFEQLKAKLG